MKDEEAQSEVVGVILILTLVMLGISVILVSGYPSLERMQENVESERMVNEMAMMDAEVSSLTFGGSARSTIRMNTGGGQLSVRNDTTRLVIVHKPFNKTAYELYNDTIGRVEYRNDDLLLGYEGGGLFRKQRGDNGSSTVIPPEFRYRGSTLTMPVVKIEGQKEFSGGATGGSLVAKQGSFTRVFPNATRSNPINNGSINVTVHTKYYRGWANHFEERTQGSVTVDHENETATAGLTIEASETFDSAVLSAGGDAHQLTFENKVEVASYDSSDGNDPPDETNDLSSEVGTVRASKNGVIKASGDVNVKNSAHMFGNVISSNQIDLKNPQSQITGNATAGDSISENPGTITGWKDENADVNIPAPFDSDPVVNHELSNAESDNDNGNTGCVSSNDLDPTGCTEIEARDDTGGNDTTTIYLDGSQTIDDTLSLDISKGNLTIAVDGGLQIESSGMVELTGDDGSDRKTSVNWYLRGDYGVSQGGEIYSDGERSAFRQFFVIHSSGDVVFEQGNNKDVVVSTIYAPNSQMEMGNSRTIYGAAIVDEFPDNTMNTVDFYFDQDLKDLDITLLDPSVAITYLHVSETEIEIE